MQNSVKFYSEVILTRHLTDFFMLNTMINVMVLREFKLHFFGELGYVELKISQEC